MSASGVADAMFQRLALTAREHADIRSSKTDHEAADKLIQILLKASGEVYQLFLDALKLSGQEHIYRLIECAGWFSKVLMGFDVQIQTTELFLF